MSRSSDATYAGIELLLSMLARTAAAGDILRKAHSEGRESSVEELAAVRAEGDALLAELDAAIEKAKGNEPTS